DGSSARKVARVEVPRRKNIVDVVVQAEHTVLHGLEHAHGGDRLADRPCLEQRVGLDRVTGLDVRYSIAAETQHDRTAREKAIDGAPPMSFPRVSAKSFCHRPPFWQAGRADATRHLR